MNKGEEKRREERNGAFPKKNPKKNGKKKIKLKIKKSETLFFDLFLK